MRRVGRWRGEGEQVEDRGSRGQIWVEVGRTGKAGKSGVGAGDRI